MDIKKKIMQNTSQKYRASYSNFEMEIVRANSENNYDRKF